MSEKDSFKIEAFSNEECRINYILHIPSIHAHSGVELLEEFVEDNDSDKSKKTLIDSNPNFQQFFDDLDRDNAYDDKEMLAETLYESGITKGFLFNVSTPIKKRGEGKSYSCSWGYSTFAWIYADTIEEGEKAAIKWAQESGWEKESKK